MKKIHLSLAFALLILLACKTEQKQATLLETNSKFDLEAADFNEDVNQLFAKHLLDEDGMGYDSITTAILNGDKQKYKISNTIVDVMKLKVPQNDFGFLYKSPSLDSVAKWFPLPQIRTRSLENWISPSIFPPMSTVSY